MSNVQVKLTDKSNFLIYESGKYIPGTGFGDAVLVAGPQGEKLQASFQPANRTLQQAAFFGAVGQVIVEVFLRTTSKQADTGDANEEYEMTISVNRVQSLGTKLVQGRIVGDVSTEALWVARFTGTRESAVNNIDVAYTQDTALGYAIDIKEMIKCGIQKALTLPTEQKMFWGTKKPRPERSLVGRRRPDINVTSMPNGTGSGSGSSGTNLPMR